MAAMHDVLAHIATLQATVPGVVRAYSALSPPESVEDLPAFVNYVAEFEDAVIDYRPSSERHTYPVTMVLLTTRQDLPEAWARLLPMVEDTRAVFRANLTLGGRVSMCQIRRWRESIVEYAGIRYVGVRFVAYCTALEPTNPAAGI